MRSQEATQFVFAIQSILKGLVVLEEASLAPISL